MKRYLNPKLMLFVLVLALGLLVVAFGRLPKVGAAAPTPTCTMNPVVTNNLDDGPGSLRQAVADACPGSLVYGMAKNGKKHKNLNNCLVLATFEKAMT